MVSVFVVIVVTSLVASCLTPWLIISVVLPRLVPTPVAAVAEREDLDRKADPIVQIIVEQTREQPRERNVGLEQQIKKKEVMVYVKDTKESNAYHMVADCGGLPCCWRALCLLISFSRVGPSHATHAAKYLPQVHQLILSL